MNDIIFYVAAIEVVIFYYIFLSYYQKLFPHKDKRYGYTIMSVISVMAIYIILKDLELRSLNIPLAGILMIIGIYFSTNMNWMQSIHGGNMCILSLYSLRDIITVIYSLFYLNDNPNILFEYSTYYVATIFSMPLSVILIVILKRTFFPDDKLKSFFYDSKYINFIVLYGIISSLNYTIINYGRFLYMDATWYIGVKFGASILTICMLIYSIYNSISASKLADYEISNKMLEEQYKRQLRHYKSYQKYTESFRAFKHDYNVMMVSLKTLIHERKNDDAIQFINSIYDTMQTRVDVHNKYSNNVILDVLMHDLANLCNENNIRFSFRSFEPKNTKLSILDNIRIFHNVTQNAFEACLEVPLEDRFIEIFSINEQRWNILQVVNSYNGNKLIDGEKFITTKNDKESHGFGLKIVKESAEKAGGFITINANSEKKVFTIRVHIPEINEKVST